MKDLSFHNGISKLGVLELIHRRDGQVKLNPELT
jgi:hypothetical protein